MLSIETGLFSFQMETIIRLISQATGDFLL